MVVPSIAIPNHIEYFLGLIEKQSRRLSELARFLPFAEQEREMETIAKELKMAVAHFRNFLTEDSTNT